MNAFFSKAVLLFAESIWRQGGMNGEGYSDVTADTAIRNVEKVRKSRKATEEAVEFAQMAELEYQHM